METEEARKLLEAQRARLQAIVEHAPSQEFGEDAQAQDSDVLDIEEHPADAPQTLVDREYEQSEQANVRSELDEIEHAMAKLDDGTYGVDEETGEPIPDERLRAVPAARYTVEVQERMERRAGVGPKGGPGAS